MLIYITEPGEIHKKAIDLLQENNHKVTFKGEPANKIEAVFIRSYTRIDKGFLNSFPNLKFVLRVGVGLDNIDIDECKKRGIQIINAAGSNANAVAELVVCLILMLLRNVMNQNLLLKKGEWRDKKFMGEELKNKTIGFVGCGAIARQVAEKVLPFKIKEILGYDPYLNEETLAGYKIKKVELNYLIKHADIISFHLPLTSETKNLISMNELKKMKKNSYIINTSRGGIVNENDLIVALQGKIVAGAALDVFENEPKIKKEFLSLENIILTPHIGAYTFESDYEMSLEPVRKFLLLLK